MISSSMVLISNFIQKEPGVIVGPISWLLGFIVNIIFNIISSFTVSHALGLTIIVLTVFTRMCMLPLSIKQQKSMIIMQKIQPELKEIQEKYKGSMKDPEAQRKMNMEMQKLYSKHSYNPFSGCFPMLIQLPIFIALYYIMQNSYSFIDEVNNIYTQIAQTIMQNPNYIEVITPIATNIVPRGMTIDINIITDLLKVLNKFTPENWDTIINALNLSGISELINTKNSIEFFMGINLTEIVGFSFPKILIAIISGFTTFLSSWLMMRKNKTADPAMKAQQNIMNIVMPIFMGYFTTNMPGGVGLYWITGNIVQIIQQIILTKHFEKKSIEEA